MNNAVREWLENPETFLRRLGEGQHWERVVAARLAAIGYDVHVPEPTTYEGWRAAAKHANSSDVVCNGHILEIKSRSLAFTSALDFPYETVMVDTVQGFNQKVDKPTMYICVSQKTGAMIGLDVRLTRKLWTERKTFDRTAKIPCTNYEAGKGLWGNVVELAKNLIV